MTSFPWHVIDSGDRFQDLIGCLLLQEVSKHVRVFVKAGRDYCIDASYEGAYDKIVGDWRFQCKHYSNFDDLKAEIRGNKSKRGQVTKEGEVDRIIGHLKCDPSSTGNRLWAKATQYRLIISLKLLPQQHQELVDLLSPLKAHGIGVDVWDGAKVEALCLSQPFVMAQIFGDNPPLFLPLSEFCRQQYRRPFGDYYSLISYTARDSLNEEFARFIQGEASAFLMTGTGGIGKTRALLEIAAAYDDDPRFKIRAVQVESQDFNQHLAELNEREQHLLIIDEADRYDELEKVLWLATRHRRFGGRVRIFAACRSAVSLPVRSSLEQAFGPHKVVHTTLPRIESASRDIARQLNHTDEVTEILIRLAEGVPLWLVLASEAIGHGARVDELTRERIISSHIDRYLDEVAPQEKELHRNLLDVFALVEPVDIRDQKSRALLSKIVGSDNPRMMRAIQDILRSGFAEQRGRFLCISPDLVADFLLIRALFTDQDLPTDRHHQLLEGQVPDMRRLISKLARAEYLTASVTRLDPRGLDQAAQAHG